VRRLEALTGAAARAYLADHDAHLREAAAVLKTKPEEVVTRVKALVDERRKLERQLAAARRQIALGPGAGAGAGAGCSDQAGALRKIGNIKLMARIVEGVQPKDLRGLVDDGKKQLGSGVVAIVAVSDEGKAAMVVGVTKDLVASLNAVDLVKAGAVALGGSGGGGRPDMAQAGGPHGDQGQAALEAVGEKIRECGSGKD